MANEYVNKVVLGSSTLIDLTADTVTADTLMQGYTAHDKSGALITGTASTTEGSVYQDEDGYLVVDDSESTAPQGNLSITANGTYDVADYAGASVSVESPVLAAMITGDFTGIDPVELPDSITFIGDYAFYQRKNLGGLRDLPSSITSIGSYAFAGLNGGLTGLRKLPDGVTAIGSYAFSGANLILDSKKLPDGITRIEDSTFNNCPWLVLTSLPDGITYIGSLAFHANYVNQITELPSSLTYIGNSAFSNCYKITPSVIPDGVTYIGTYAFQACELIPKISCNGVITTLGAYAFVGSSSRPMQLAEASFPNMALTSNLGTVFGSVTAANACQQLKFCDIGSTVGIADNAFANCYKLQTLVIRKTASVCVLANVSAFSNTPMRGYNGLTGTVYVPSALISAYQTATNWSTLYNDGTVTFAAIEGSEYERD